MPTPKTTMRGSGTGTFFSCCDKLPDPPAQGGREPKKRNGANASNRLLVDGSGAYSLRMAGRMLPTGMTSLRKIRTRDCYYVDKTDHARRLVEGGDFYFLSRPRR